MATPVNADLPESLNAEVRDQTTAMMTAASPSDTSLPAMCEQMPAIRAHASGIQRSIHAAEVSDSAGDGVPVRIFEGLPHAYWAYLLAPEGAGAFELEAT